MFKAPNPFEEIVAKATDENLTSEDWGLNLQVCDKLSGDDEQDARNCMAAVQKRLSHRSANVQLYALTLADTLSKNCGDAVHHEIASRAFMQAITRLTTERQTHPMVKKRALVLLREWANEYKDNDTLGLVGETVHALKDEYYDIDDDTVAAPKGPVRSQVVVATQADISRPPSSCRPRRRSCVGRWSCPSGSKGGAACQPPR